MAARTRRIRLASTVSLLATLEQVRTDPLLAHALVDPFALTPGFRGPPQPDDERAAWDSLAGAP